MRTKASLLFGALLLACSATLAHATQYPPPGDNNPADTLVKISFIQNPASVPFPVAPDTVWGIGGIITGFDTFPTGFGFYIQNSQGGPWTGVDVFTGGTNYQPDVVRFPGGLQRGDSVMVYGRMDEFSGLTELRGFNTSSFNDPLPGVRRISQGNALPPFKVGTFTELQELPTNLNAEQWEGGLVRVRTKMVVRRTSTQGTAGNNGGLGTFNSFLCVATTCTGPGACDSLFIDASTLANPALTPPPVGALIDSVQGIYGQAGRGYRIQLRDGSDIFDSQPPGLNDAYAIAADSVRCVFDRNLTAASASNKNNFTLSSTALSVTAAVPQLTNGVPNNVVHCKVINGLSPCDAEGITVNHLVNASNNVAMTVAATLNFRNGICPLASIQAPDPAQLSASPCNDASLYAGAGGIPGGRITTQGVCTLTYGSNYFIETSPAAQRAGVVLFAPSSPLVVGHQYLIAGAVQEFFTETELVQTVYIQDQGAVAAPVPFVEPIGVLRDTTCDATQSVLNGEDFEGVLVTASGRNTSVGGTPGQGFFLANPNPANPDTIYIDNNVARTFTPLQNHYYTVTGVMDLSFGAWHIQPRGNSDIVLTNSLGVDNGLPAVVSFDITPNPGRAARVTFALPRRDKVHIAVYDVAGRRRAVLADGEYPAGTNHVDWGGTSPDGAPVKAGMYFYRMTVGDKTYKRQAVLLN